MVKIRIWKRCVTFALAAVLSIGIIQVPAAAAATAAEANTEWPQGPAVSCGNAVMIEATNGVVLYDKGMDEVCYPASITKIMTALLAIENLSLDDQISFSETSVATELVPGSSTINMKLGETITVEDCLYGLMIKSANEAAVQLGEEVSGTEAAFAQKMTERARELGCKNTNFTNASGLPDENHYTTAYDMALIFREALKNETFRKIIGTQSYTIPATGVSGERALNTAHPLLAAEAPEHYEGCIGGKSGNTAASGKTLVTGAQRNNMTLIVVVLKGADMGPNCQDTTHLLDFGFQSFQKMDMQKGSVIVPAGVTAAQVKTEEEKREDGKTLLNYSYQDKVVGTAIKEPAEEKKTEPVKEQEKSPQEESQKVQEPDESSGSFFTVTNILLTILGVLILVMLVLLVILKRQDRRGRRRRRKKSRRR